MRNANVRVSLSFIFCLSLLTGCFVTNPPVLIAQLASVTWVHMNTGGHIPGNALVGGSDYDAHVGTVEHQPMFVCRVATHGGLHPGKLLNNNCNVSWGGSGTEYHDFEVATNSGGPGHWAPFDPAQTSQMLVGGHEAGGATLYVCHANHIHKQTVAGFLFPQDHDSGIHSGKLVNGKCDVEWGSRELALDQYVQVFYLTPPIQPTPQCDVPGKPKCVTPPPGHTNVASITVNPTSISLGQSVTITVTLDRPAPPATGVSLRYWSEGTSNIYASQPLNIPFATGATSGSATLVTQSAAFAPTSITITAGIVGGAAKSTVLSIH